MTIEVRAPAAGDEIWGAGIYWSVGLSAGSVIALQIAIMRVFAVGSWAHFGSLVVSLAMLGFGIASVVVLQAARWIDRHWRLSAGASLLAFGPLAVITNLVAQTVPFNPIFLVSDPDQKWYLLANFLLYLLPFLSGAFFLGIVFRTARERFGRVYFADLTGAGLAGMVILGALYILPPEHLMIAPLALWGAAGLAWFGRRRGPWPLLVVGVLFAVTVATYVLAPPLLGIPDIAVSQYKGVSYARNFPDQRRLYRDFSPFGDLEIYASSYMHFAPGLSDNAAFNVPELPANSYVAMYIDGDGPEGIMAALPVEDAAYYRYLPMFYPYVLKTRPDVFVVQFGGGISTMTALNSGANSVTVAESNPEVLKAFRDPVLKQATADVLNDPRISVVDYDGRLFLAHTDKRYDIIDLSLADSVGLSNPGGFAIVEKYPYTVEAMRNYMGALKPGGILSITLWNKEEPPKSILKLFSTVAAAARQMAGDPKNAIFVSSSYLSTTTVLYKRGGFTAGEVARLGNQTEALSFDEIYAPGIPFDPNESKGILDQYWQSIFGAGDQSTAAIVPADQTAAGAADSTGPMDGATDPSEDTAGPQADAPTIMPATSLARLAWHDLLHGGSTDIADSYVFDVRPLTNDRPYFAAYVRPADLGKTLDRLDIFQDDWGYLLVWATLGIAIVAAGSLIALPMIFSWRSVFVRTPGKFGTIVFFACLGLGYIMVEVGLISRFTEALANATISASVLISAMLVFSGLGAFLAERIVPRARVFLPAILVATAAMLAIYGLFLPVWLDWIGTFPYPVRLISCFFGIAPPAFLMGFPMATAMTTLARLGKDRLFVWAWGINGCFSVVGAAAVPLIATSFGLAAVLQMSAGAYLLAVPAFFSVALPIARRLAVLLP